MNFQRTYDISCLMDDLAKSGLQNAIDAVNMACTPTIDAWLYVESREIALDYNRVIEPTNTMKNTIFNHMNIFGHSGSSITYTIHNLISLALDYDTWKRAHEEDNSLVEGEIQMIEQFRQNILVPHYRSMSDGGCIRVSAGPIISEFLEMYDRFTYKSNPEISRIYQEVIGLLGTTLDERVKVLDTILTTVYSPQSLINYRNSLKKIKENEKRMEDYHDTMITNQIPILRAAIESRNPIALQAALEPGWGSMRFCELKEYKQAQELLDKLSSSGVQVAENKS
jgi:hypothetical protein